MADTEDTGSTGDSAKSDMKAKFREALDKKKNQTHATAEGAEHDGSEKSHGATGPTQSPEFRRKSV